MTAGTASRTTTSTTTATLVAATTTATPVAPARIDHREQPPEMTEHKPTWRGWLHTATTPFALAAGIVLVVLAPTDTIRTGAVIFTASAVLLFGVSGVYHVGTWSPATYVLLKRWDHANVYLLIAGTYTPFALLLLDGGAQRLLLVTVWSAAGIGAIFRVLWVSAPRRLYSLVCLGLGWSAALFLADFFAGAVAIGPIIGMVAFTLMLGGGILYTIGGVIYGLQRPNPWPTHFGFHEIFHVLTILAFAAHVSGICLVMAAAG